MEDGKHGMQADGSGEGTGNIKPRPADEAQGGESGGGSYPNPHTGKKPSGDGPDTFMGHGGQTDIGYRGSGDSRDGDTNENAVTDDD